MTQIDFYTRVTDKLATACRITHKARQQNLRVTVFCPDAALAREFDRMLWAHPATGFLPHCPSAHPLAASTPVLIDATGDCTLNCDVLINLHHEWPACFSRYQRLAEIVTNDPDDATQARARFKHYRDRGYALRTHDLSAP